MREEEIEAEIKKRVGLRYEERADTGGWNSRRLTDLKDTNSLRDIIL